MFKYENCEEELLESMANKLDNSNQSNKINKLSKTIDYLNSAILIFKKAGLIKEANQISKVLNAVISGE